MKKYIFFVLISTTIYSQDLQKNKNLDSLADIFSLEEVTVNALRAQKDTPVPFINISKKDLEKVNLAQDLPTLLKNTPSVLTTSDSGSGIGYSSIQYLIFTVLAILGYLSWKKILLKNSH